MELNQTESSSQIDKLRHQIQTERERPESPSLSIQRTFPSINLRSSTQSVPKSELLHRDLSHRLDSSSKIRSNFQYHKAKLHEILGVKSKPHNLPTSLEELQATNRKNKSGDSKKRLANDLASLKVKISKNKEKLLKKVANEGGLLFRTQSGLIQPQITSIYEQILKKGQNLSFDLPRTELDLGAPSGRKEVEMIIVWLEMMINTYVNNAKDITLKEKNKRAQLIYTTCFKEVIRQVSAHCLERGVLLQKIWNAQIDIYCHEEEKQIQKIEDLEKRFRGVMAENVRNYKDKIEALEKNCKELKEMDAGKEKEISWLKFKLEEVKAQAEKDRKVYLGSYKKPEVRKSIEAEEIKKATRRESITRNEILTKSPTILIGYFDSEQLFRKVRAIQYDKSDQISQEYLEEIVPLLETESKTTDTCDLKYYIEDEEVLNVTNVSCQAPETPKLEIQKEFEFTYKTYKNFFLMNYKSGRNSMTAVQGKFKERSSRGSSADLQIMDPKAKTFSDLASLSLALKYEYTEPAGEDSFAKGSGSEYQIDSINGSKNLRESIDYLDTDRKIEEKDQYLEEFSNSESNFLQTERSERQVDTVENDDEELKEQEEKQQSLSNTYEEEIKKESDEDNESEADKGFVEKELKNEKIEGEASGKQVEAENIKKSLIKGEQTSNAYNLEEKSYGGPKSNKEEKNYDLIKVNSEKIESQKISKKKNKKQEVRKDKAKIKKHKNTEKEIENNIENFISEKVLVKKQSQTKLKSLENLKKNQSEASIFSEANLKLKKEGLQSFETLKKITEKRRLSRHTTKDPIKSQILNPQNEDSPITLEKSELKQNHSKRASKSHSSSSSRSRKIAEAVSKPNPEKVLQSDLIEKPKVRRLSLLKSSAAIMPSSLRRKTIIDDLKSEYCQADLNPIDYLELTSPQVHSTINHLKKILKGISNDSKRKKELLKDTTSIKRASELGMIISKLFPNQFSSEESRNSKSFEDKYCQTGELDYKEIMETRNLDEKAQGSVKADAMKKYKRVVKSFTYKKGNPRDRPQILQLESKSNSQNVSKTIKSISQKNLRTIAFDEFALGQVFRRIILAHPGQKINQFILTEIKGNAIRCDISLKSLMKSITTVYQEKIYLSKENVAYWKSEACMILYDMLMNRYGLKVVAENKFKQIVLAAMFYKEKHERVKNFAMFLGGDGDYQVEDWNFYLNCLETLEYSNFGKSLFNEDTAITHFSPFIRGLQTIHVIFDGKLPEDTIENVLNEVSQLKIEDNQLIPKKSAAKLVENINTDMFINILMKYFLEIKEKISKKYFCESDKDDVLNEEEFAAAIRKIRNIEADLLVKMFEKYCIFRKVEDEKLEKVIKIRAILALIFDYSLVDIRVVYKQTDL